MKYYFLHYENRLLIVGVKDPELSLTEQEWTEAYLSREVLTRKEVNLLIEDVRSRSGLSKKILKERFYNLKKQRFVDTIRGRIT